MAHQSQNLTRWSVLLAWRVPRSPARGQNHCTSQKPALAAIWRLTIKRPDSRFGTPPHLTALLGGEEELPDIKDCCSLILKSGSAYFPQVSRCPRAHPRRPSPNSDKRALLAGHDQRRGNRMSVNRLPPVGRIRAVHLPEGGPRVPKSLTIEYSDRGNASKWYQLEVPFVDAMHLLALLQGAKDDVGYKEPVETPAPNKD